MKSIAFKIAQLVLSIFKQQGNGKVQKGAAVGDAVLKIIEKSVDDDKQQTGKEVDSSLIKPAG